LNGAQIPLPRRTGRFVPAGHADLKVRIP
jgi:hypothetical protein